MVSWTSDKDAILLMGIFEFMDIKCSGPLLEYLSKKIGDGCTPKAVSHRLNNMKKKGSGNNGPSTPTKASTPKSQAGPKTPRSNKTSKSGNASTGKGRNKNTNNDDHEEIVSPSVSATKKRAKTMESDEGDEFDGMTPMKKMKLENDFEDDDFGGFENGNADLDGQFA